MVLLSLAALAFAQPVEIDVRKIDGSCARSLIRAWNQIHVEKLKLHDFIPLLAPDARCETWTYKGAIRHDDVKSIAVVDDSDAVVGIAYNVDSLAVASALAVHLTLEGFDMSSVAPRWQLEANMVREDSEGSRYYYSDETGGE